MKVDTIYAPSTAIGGAIALIRVSGSLCPDIAREMLDRDVTKTPRMLRFVRMLDGDRVLDDGMACFLPGKGTYTGEDMLELFQPGAFSSVWSCCQQHQHPPAHAGSQAPSFTCRGSLWRWGQETGSQALHVIHTCPGA